MAQTKSDLLLHPVRMRLVTELAGRQMTPGQLAAALPDVPQATLYRQINRLLEGGVFEVVAEQVVNGATERTYAVVGGGDRLSLGRAAGDHAGSACTLLFHLCRRADRYVYPLRAAGRPQPNWPRTG
jgi:hypothetical protein